MKRIIVTGFLVMCLATMLIGCGDRNNSATEPTAQATSTAPADNAESNGGMNEENDLSDDVKNGVDDAADGINDAVDNVDDAVDDMTDGGNNQ